MIFPFHVLAPAAALATGSLVALLWAPLGLSLAGAPGDAPFPGVWRGTFAVIWAAQFPAFTAAHATIPAAGAARRWDRRSYALLPGILLVMAAARLAGGWRQWLALLVVGVLLAKVLLLISALYRGFIGGESGADAGGDPAALPRHLVAAGLLFYGLLAPYVVAAVSAGGDEPLYLLNVGSLATDGDVAIRDNVARGDFRRHYWGQAAPASWTSEFPAFAALLLPGYVAAEALLPGYPLAGRLGATLTVSLCAALLGAQLYLLCRDLGASRPAAFWAWLVTLASPAVVVHAGHVYPELPAGLLLVAGVRAVLRLPGRAGMSLAVVAASDGALVLLKQRYAALALGLGLWALARAAGRRRAPAVALTVALGAALLWAGDGLWLPHRGDGARPLALWPPWRDWGGGTLAALVGVHVDQEVGLWMYLPHGLLAAVGLPLLWRRRPAAALGLLGLVTLYLLVLVTYRAMWWHGGLTPPPRMILPAAFLLIPFLAEVFDRCRGPALATANTLGLAWAGAGTLTLALLPAWRYQNLDGRATLLQAAGEALGLDLARFWPSLIAPTAWTWLVVALASAGVLGATLLAARSRATPLAGWGADAMWLRPRPAARLLLGLGLAWIGAAALVPTWVVEVAAMRSTSGQQQQVFEESPLRTLWSMTADGELAAPIVTWPGVTEIAVVCGSYTTGGPAPRLLVLLDDRTVAAWVLRAERGRWARDECVARVETSFGHPRLRLQLVGLVDDAATGHFQHAYVERVRLRWRAGTP